MERDVFVAPTKEQRLMITGMISDLSRTVSLGISEFNLHQIKASLDAISLMSRYAFEDGPQDFNFGCTGSSIARLAIIDCLDRIKGTETKWGGHAIVFADICDIDLAQINKDKEVDRDYYRNRLISETEHQMIKEICMKMIINHH